MWWLSFCDPKRPAGQQFLGVAIVAGTDLVEATKNAWANECNPGGEVMGQKIDEVSARFVGPEWVNRLLTKEQCEFLDREVGERKRMAVS